MQHRQILDTAGGTPMVELKRLSPKPGVRLFAKLEGFNPTGSVKDRVVEHMLEHAVAEGRIAPGGTIVEASTGNTGIALAMMGRRLGYRVRIVVPENVYPEIPRMLAVYGADVQWTSAAAGVTGALAVAQTIAAEEGCYLFDQFSSEHNAHAHYLGTGAEILEDVAEVDVFIAGVGTGGTIMGAGRRLKERRAGTRVVAVEPQPGCQVQGIRSLAEGFIPPILDLEFLDGKLLVRSDQAFRATRLVMEREGIFAGVSSGAVLHVALRLAERMPRGNIVMMFADSGWKYLGTDLWSRDLPAEVEDESLDDIFWW